MKLSIVAAALSLLAAPAFADGHAGPSGDVEAGEAAFNRQCVACHVVVDADGNKLAGRSAKTGPNLYAIANRQAGIVEGFRYGKSMVEAGEAGLMWDEASFVPYVQDPNDFLRTFLDNKRARGKMAFKVRAEEDAINMYAYLYSLAPPAAE
ncbi:UNVERIFIED_CONTAM: hypothetical protein GTU68_018623 [Idotea baltica]|nr:hypothetical protein [Idotea baltica]